MVDVAAGIEFDQAIERGAVAHCLAEQGKEDLVGLGDDGQAVRMIFGIGVGCIEGAQVAIALLDDGLHGRRALVLYGFDGLLELLQAVMNFAGVGTLAVEVGGHGKGLH